MPRQRTDDAGVIDAMQEISLVDSWRDRVEAVSGRRQDTILIAGLVLLLVAGFLLLRARAGEPRIAPPAAVAPTAASAPAVAREAGLVLVHVSGAVRTPGLYELPSGARVADAVEAAGGPRPFADLNLLNLAEPVIDGSKVEVLRRGAQASATAVQAGADPAGTVVHLNSADQETLETIPGIGPARAGAILEFRTELGGFSSLDQLLDVPGIGPSILEAIRPYVAL